MPKRFEPHTRFNPRIVFTQETRQMIYDRDEGICTYCRESVPFGKFEVDHLVPKAGGGTDELSNLTTACWCCNLVKGTFPAATFVLQLAQRGLGWRNREAQRLAVRSEYYRRYLE